MLLLAARDLRGFLRQQKPLLRLQERHLQVLYHIQLDHGLSCRLQFDSAILLRFLGVQDGHQDFEPANHAGMLDGLLGAAREYRVHLAACKR